MSQKSIFDIFNNNPHVQEFKKNQESEKKANQEKKNSKQNNNSSNGKKTANTTTFKEKELEVFLPVTICYAGCQQQFNVEDFDSSVILISDVSEKDIDKNATVKTHETEDPSTISDIKKSSEAPRILVENLRKLKLEKSFPELSKERTRFEYEEAENRLIVICHAGTKGADLSAFENYIFDSSKINCSITSRNVVACTNGYFKIHVTPIGIFSVKAEIPGLDYGKEGLKLTIPKIPINLLHRSISFFKSIYKQYGTESMVQIYYIESQKNFEISVPIQRVSSSYVQYINTGLTDNMNLVLTLHSHPTYPACFSITDNQDEVATGLYGVVSLSEKNCLFRMSVSGSYMYIPIEEIFSFSHDIIKKGDLFRVETSFPVEWNKKIWPHIYGGIYHAGQKF